MIEAAKVGGAAPPAADLAKLFARVAAMRVDPDYQAMLKLYNEIKQVFAETRDEDNPVKEIENLKAAQPELKDLDDRAAKILTESTNETILRDITQLYTDITTIEYGAKQRVRELEAKIEQLKKDLNASKAKWLRGAAKKKLDPEYWKALIT